MKGVEKLNHLHEMIEMNVTEDLSEVVKYNTLNMPIKVMHNRLSCYQNLSAACHWHEDVEFIIVLRGEMNFFVEGKVYLLRENMGIFINSNRLHYGFSENNEDCEFLCILFHPRLISINPYIESTYVSSFIHSRSLSTILLNPLIAWKEQLIQYVKQVFNLFETRTEGYELLVQSILFSIWRLLYSYSATENELEKKVEMLELKNMIRFIQSHHAKKITLHQIAGAGMVSRSKCCILFKEHLSLSPIQYLMKYRLEKSKKLLINHSLTVSDIAQECGFSSSSYFTEIFHREVGMTPTIFRGTINNHKN